MAICGHDFPLISAPKSTSCHMEQSGSRCPFFQDWASDTLDHACEACRSGLLDPYRIFARMHVYQLQVLLPCFAKKYESDPLRQTDAVYESGALNRLEVINWDE